MIEIIEMVQILQRMDTDTYQECKYTMLAGNRERPLVENFTRMLFSLTDSRRPLQIGMKGGTECQSG